MKQLLKSMAAVLAIALGIAPSLFISVGAGFADPSRMDFSEITYSEDFQPQFRSYNEPTIEIPMTNGQNKLTLGGSVALDYYMFKHAKTLDKTLEWDRNDQFRQRNEFGAEFQAMINPEAARSMVKAKIILGNTLFLRTFYSPLDYTDGTIKAGSAAIDFEQTPSQVKFQEAWAQVDLGEVFKDKSDAKNYFKFGYFPFMVGRGISLGDWTQGGVTYMGFGRTGLQTYTPMFPGGFLWHCQVGKLANVELYFSPTVSEDITGAQRTGGVAIEEDVRESYGRHIFAVSAKIHPKLKQASILINPYWVYYNSPRQSVDCAMDAPLDMHTIGCMVHAKSGAMEGNFEIAKQIGTQEFKRRVYKDFPSVEHYDFDAPLQAGTGDTANQYFVWRPTSPENGKPGYVNIPRFAEVPGKNLLGEHHPAFTVKLSGWMMALDLRYHCKDYPLSLATAFGYFSGGDYPYNDNVDKFWLSEKSEKEGKGYKVSPFDAVSSATSGLATINQPIKVDYKGFLPLRDYKYVGMWAHPLVLVNAGIVPRPKQLSMFDFVSWNDTDTLTNMFYVGAGFDLKPLADKEKLKINGNFFSYWSDSKLYKWDKKKAKDPKIKYAEGQSGAEIDNIEGWQTDVTASSFYGYEFSAIVTWKMAKNLEFSFRAGVFIPGQLYKDLEGMPNTNTQYTKRKIDQNNSVEETPVYASLGHDAAWGAYARIKYSF